MLHVLCNANLYNYDTNDNSSIIAFLYHIRKHISILIEIGLIFVMRELLLLTEWRLKKIALGIYYIVV